MTEEKNETPADAAPETPPKKEHAPPRLRATDLIKRLTAAARGAVDGAKKAYGDNTPAPAPEEDARAATPKEVRAIVRGELKRQGRRKFMRGAAITTAAGLLAVGHCARSPDKLEAKAKAGSERMHRADVATGGVQGKAADFRKSQIDKWIERTADADRAVRKMFWKSALSTQPDTPKETNAVSRVRNIKGGRD